MSKVTVKGLDTRERLVDAATDLFSDTGYEKTSLASVAARCGLTHAAALYHFKTKQGLLEAVSESALARAEALVNEAYEKDDDAYARLVKFFSQHVTWMIIYKAQAESLLILSYYAATQPEFAAIFSRVVEKKREQIEALLIAGKREGLFSFTIPSLVAAKCLHDGLFGMLMNGLAGRRIVEPMPAYLERIQLLIGSIAGYAPKRGG